MVVAITFRVGSGVGLGVGMQAATSTLDISGLLMGAVGRCQFNFENPMQTLKSCSGSISRNQNLDVTALQNELHLETDRNRTLRI
ncbi:MAG: hypothetical protein A2Z14_07275 [Chloroflexi bacterium RBG_16_48_8]|nr:MAG: hypothetical protein A2Z14_07275 [Chloroflexi bacterium RBG_16_48_8]